MAIRPEIVQTLRTLGQDGGIPVQFGAGGAALTQLEELTARTNQARGDLLRNKLPTAYRINVFGSARPGPDTPEYAFARDLAHGLVEATGADIITGGGNGLIAAALEGASSANPNVEGLIDSPKSVRRYGINIRLPWEQTTNSYVTHGTTHEEFMSRLQAFADMSHGSYVGPGGIGSMEELMTVLQLRQVGHLESDYPIVAHTVWERPIAALHKMMYQDRVNAGAQPYVSEGDFNLVFSADVPTIVDIFTAHHRKWYTEIGSRVRMIN